MTDYDPQFAAELRRIADAVPATEAPGMRVLERAKRRRRTKRSILAATCVSGLAAAAAVAIVLQPSAAPSADAQHPADVQRPSGSLRLVSAMTATSSASFQVGIKVSATTSEPHASLSTQDRKLLKELTDSPRTARGAFDPRRRVGYLRTPDAGGSVEQRLIDGMRFIGDGRRWKVDPGPHDALSLSGLAGEQLALSADPAGLLASVRQLGTVRPPTTTGTGTAAREHYAFTVSRRVPLPRAPGEPARFVTRRVTGEIAVHTDRQLISEVTYRVPFDEAGPQPKILAAVTIAFTGYGTPVNVTRPTAVIR